MSSITQGVASVNATDGCCPSADTTRALAAANARLLALRARQSAPAGLSSAAWSLRIVVRPAVTHPSLTAVLRLHPSLLAALRRHGHDAPGRIWLLCRYLDRAGQGWLPVDTVRRALCGSGPGTLPPDVNPLPRLCGWRRLRQLLQQGRGVFWERDRFGRIWLAGAATVAARLGIARLTGRPVNVPVHALTRSLRHARAHCYAAFHAGRPTVSDGSGNPISRTTLARLTAVPARTQRAYDRLIGVPRQANVAVGPRATGDAVTAAAWRHGPALFTLVDHRGQHGAPGGRYCAWQLPNGYRRLPSHAAAPRGRQRKINRHLQRRRRPTESRTDLVDNRERGNGAGDSAESARTTCTQPHRRIFFHDTRQAAAPTDASTYWRSTRAGIWHPLERTAA